jgi:hypothetical protein
VLRLLTGTGVKRAEQARGSRRKISVAGRKRIAAAQGATWRKIKAGRKWAGRGRTRDELRKPENKG